MPGRKGQTHEDDKVREAAIHYWNQPHIYGKNRALIARKLIADGLMTVPRSDDPKTAFETAARNVRGWVQSYQDLSSHRAAGTRHMSKRQYEADRKRKAKEEAKHHQENVIKRRRARGMTLAERTFICTTLTANPETTTSELAFQLSNQFGSNWADRTIQNNRKAMGFNAKQSSPVNRASCPVTRNMYKMLWQAYGIQTWQVRAGCCFGWRHSATADSRVCLGHAD